MNTLLQRVLKAYRPLYLRGLLLDGQYRLPKSPAADAAAATPPSRRRMQPVVLTGLRHAFSRQRSKS